MTATGILTGSEGTGTAARPFSRLPCGLPPLATVLPGGEILDWRGKGFPAGAGAVSVDEVGQQGWEIPREDLMLPVAVLRQSALRHNSDWMRRFTTLAGVRIAPHGKTTMSPQLFALQLADGAWGLTAATVGHVRIYRQQGITRILLANQLVGEQNIAYIANELRCDPQFDFYCLVDSVAAVELLESSFERDPVGRRVQVLVELGFKGGRGGFRDNKEALRVSRRIAASKHLCLRGIEAFEGIIQGSKGAEPRMTSMLERILDLAISCEEEALFKGTPILTAGGSSFFDVVAETLSNGNLRARFEVVLRSGCYLVHDSQFYDELVGRLMLRSSTAASLGEGLRPALEVWAYVHSRPEPNRVIAGLGKRDISADILMPKPLMWARPRSAKGILPIPPGHETVRLDDQHAYLDVPSGSPLSPGDMVGFGISHPCTTFDKWQVLYVVDDRLRVVGAVRTYF